MNETDLRALAEGWAKRIEFGDPVGRLARDYLALLSEKEVLLADWEDNRLILQDVLAALGVEDYGEIPGRIKQLLSEKEAAEQERDRERRLRERAECESQMFHDKWDAAEVEAERWKRLAGARRGVSDDTEVLVETLNWLLHDIRKGNLEGHFGASLNQALRVVEGQEEKP